jgi:hypothetical protein
MEASEAGGLSAGALRRDLLTLLEFMRKRQLATMDQRFHVPE